MSYDMYYDWSYERPRRWRRWVARLVALLALVACGFGVWTIVRQATKDSAPPPATLAPELRQLAESGDALAKRLGALRAGRSASKALAAAKEVQADQRAAVARLTGARAEGKVRAADAVGAALSAQGAYLAVVLRVLEHPRTRTVANLAPRARRAREAFTSVPGAQANVRAIRGWKRLAAYARASHG